MATEQLVEKLEAHVAEWFTFHSSVPDSEVHDDRDVVWIVHPAISWANAGVLVRFTERSVVKRLQTILDRYRAAKKGVGGFWVSDLATPANLDEHLRRHGLRCRKRFPVMSVDLTTARPAIRPPAGIAIVEVDNSDLFRRTVHPYWGRISTEIRRRAMDGLDALLARRPQRVWCYAAMRDGAPVGVCVLFVGTHGMSSLWDVGVVERERNRGIGRAIVAHACGIAREHRAKRTMLIASGMGEAMYARAGFEENTRFGFWYANLRAGAAARRGMVSALLRVRAKERR